MVAKHKIVQINANLTREIVIEKKREIEIEREREGAGKPLHSVNKLCGKKLRTFTQRRD